MKKFTTRTRLIKKTRLLTAPIPAVLIVIAAVLAGTLGYAVRSSQMGQTQPNITAEVAVSSEKKDAVAAADHTSSQNDLLAYLIEEEKLAHDVYTVMYQQYGAKVFGNVLESEQTHQSRVLALLDTRGLADPRSSEFGVFANAELQELYGQLVARGKQSVTDAYSVGKAIEEKDISDIDKQLATATSSDIIATLESLRIGSENHLRAFNRQLGKY